MLWIDQRLTGFSYPMSPPDGHCVFDVLDDAADFVRVMLDFIDAHPRLSHVPIGIVGESYGGTRAIAMLHDGLKAPVTRWLGGDPTPETVTKHLLGLVLIQPFALGSLQFDARADEVHRILLENRGKDPYDVRQPANVEDPFGVLDVLQAFARPDDAKLLFGVDFAKTPRLGPASRSSAARAGEADDYAPAAALNEALTAQVGRLGEHDRYYEPISRECNGGAIRNLRDADPNMFLEALRTVPLFITDAKIDAVVLTHVIFDLLAQIGASVDAVARPGYRLVTVPAFT